MNRVHLVLRHRPNGSLAALELVDLALVSATFAVPTRVFLEGAGVLHAVNATSSPLAYSLRGRLDSITLYDMEPLVIDRDDWTAFGLTEAHCLAPVEILDHAEYLALLRTADVILEG